MSDLDLNDIELKEHDPYHDYMEEKNRDAELESVSQENDLYSSKEISKDEYIYHTMGRLYYLSNGNEWL